MVWSCGLQNPELAATPFMVAQAAAALTTFGAVDLVAAYAYPSAPRPALPVASVAR